MLDFPKSGYPADFQFNRNLLKSVIFQLKYECADDIISRLSDLKEKLKSKFPIVNPIHVSSAEVKFEKNKTPILQSASSSNQGWEFKSDDNTKILGITGDTLTYTVNGREYENFQKAFFEIKESFFPVLKEFNIINFHRVAIRKINLIEPKDDQVSIEKLLSVFNKELVSNFHSFPVLDLMVSGVFNVRMEKAEKQLNLSYGLISPIDKKKKTKVLLDIDLMLLDQNLGLDSIESKWKEIKEEIFNIFCWAISKNLRDEISKK